MELGVQRSQDRFPLLWARLPFPAADCALELRFRYGNPTACGTAIGVGSAAYDGARYQEGSVPPSDIEDVLSVQQTNTEFRIRLLGRIGWSRPAPDTAWHVMRLSREGSTYRLVLDGRDIGSVPYSEVTAQSLYLGSAVIMRSAGPWTPMQIDYVRLQVCSVWGTECLWLPLILLAG
jgi:hypothetical protein